MVQTANKINFLWRLYAKEIKLFFKSYKNNRVETKFSVLRWHTINFSAVKMVKLGTRSKQDEFVIEVTGKGN